LKPLTTVVDLAQPADTRGNPVIVRQPTVPFKTRRLEDPTPEKLAQTVHEIQENLHELTQGIRTMPEGGARTYFKDVTFQVGILKELSHYLGVSSPATSQYSQPSNAQASDPTQIRFEVLNHRGAFGGCYRYAINARTITLMPNASFTADVRLFVVA
jgi:hypothetical protein